MPVEARSSVVVVSTHLAHRRQRSTSTDATGGESMPLKLPEETTESVDDVYELAEDAEAVLS